MYYTYIIRCEDNSLYTGYAVDLQKRLKQHYMGKGAKYTRTHHPTQLVYAQVFQEKGDALRREAEIKKMNKAQKEALSKGTYLLNESIDSNEVLLESVGMRNQAMGHALVEWYQKNQRDLPWRKDKEPYHIWISEIMSQQTRIATMIPYYFEFLNKFPTISDLAKAKEDEFLKQWEGLGYYSRARNLHRAAKMIEEEYEGELPNDIKELKKLPGIGDYTAAAIASIAFDQAKVAVDGNVMRVYSRAEASFDDIAAQTTKKKIEQQMESWIPLGYESDFTQSLMDLGAMVCMPTQVLCEKCPIAGYCCSKNQEFVLSLPIKKTIAKKQKIRRAVLLIRNQNGQWLLHQRKEALLKNLWEFPSWDMPEDVSLEINFLQKKASEMGFQSNTWVDVGSAKHIFTHLIWQMRGYFLLINSPEEENCFDEYEWVFYHDFKEKTWPTALRYYLTWIDQYEKRKQASRNE